MEQDYYRDFHQLREWTEKACDVLGSQVPPPASPAAREALAGAAGLAYELRQRARRPVSIGLVGEYSVGKSRLLNTLLGLSELLPVSGEPTTGNTTALRVRAARPGQEPGELSAAISWLSRPELSEVARFIVRKLVSVITDNGLVGYDIGVLRDYDPVAHGWEAFEALARGWWHQEAATDVRLYAWELLRLRDAMLIGAALIPDRPGVRPEVVDRDIAREAIEIRKARTELPVRFPERPVRPPIQAGDELTAPALRVLFPLIRRLTYDIAIDPGLLTLSGLRDSNGLELLDFAGLNAVGGARDEWLCYQEIAGITAYLAVVQARRPETATVTRFESMLEGDRSTKQYLADSRLLVANMFDEIEVPRPARVRDSGLAGASGKLGSLLRMAAVMGKSPDRVALTSTMPDLVDRDWAAVADALDTRGADDGEAPMSAALRAYAADGGIARLRDTLSGLIGTKAMPIIMAELTARRAELRAAIARLRNLLAPAAADGEVERELLLGMVAEIAQMAAEAKAGSARYRDPEKIEVAEEAQKREPDKPAGLLERIRQDAVLEVYAWNQWRAVFAYIRDGRIGAFPAGGARRAGRDPGDGAGALRIPDDTSEFEGPFNETLSDLRRNAGGLARDAVTEWIGDLHKHHADLRARIADPGLRSRLVELIEAAYPGAGAARVESLADITDLGWISESFAESLAAAQRWADGAEVDAFPLAQGHALPWSGARARSADTTLAHPSRAHRLRHDLAEGAAFTVQTIMAMAFGAFEADLDRELSWLLSQVPNEHDLRDAVVAPAAVNADDGDCAEGIALLDDLLSQPGAGTDEDETGATGEEER
jgi:hypothetical protein